MEGARTTRLEFQGVSSSPTDSGAGDDAGCEDGGTGDGHDGLIAGRPESAIVPGVSGRTRLVRSGMSAVGTTGGALAVETRFVGILGIVGMGGVSG